MEKRESATRVIFLWTFLRRLCTCVSLHISPEIRFAFALLFVWCGDTKSHVGEKHSLRLARVPASTELTCCERGNPFLVLTASVSACFALNASALPFCASQCTKTSEMQGSGQGDGDLRRDAKRNAFNVNQA